MFNSEKFKNEKYEPRIIEVPVPNLIDLFDGSEPIFKVRGQTSVEVVQTAEIGINEKDLTTLVKAISSSTDQVRDIKEHLGLSDEVPLSLKKRLKQLTQCCVEPTIDMQAAVLLAERHPLEFGQITNAIAEATNLGMNIKKSLPSGKTKK